LLVLWKSSRHSSHVFNRFLARHGKIEGDLTTFWIPLKCDSLSIMPVPNRLPLDMSSSSSFREFLFGIPMQTFANSLSP
jgi:hypothetical protein